MIKKILILFNSKFEFISVPCYRISVNGDSPKHRSWHTLTAIADDKLFLFGGLSADNVPLSKSIQFSIWSFPSLPQVLWCAVPRWQASGEGCTVSQSLPEECGSLRGPLSWRCGWLETVLHFFLFYVWEHMNVYVRCASEHVWKTGQRMRVGSLLIPCGLQGSNSDHWALQLVPLPSESSISVFFFFWLILFPTYTEVILFSQYFQPYICRVGIITHW